MVVGFISISPSDIVQNSRGNPPASHTPRFTASATWRRCALQLFSSLQELQMPITGFPSNTRSLKPSARSQARCASPQRSSLPNQSRLRSFVDLSLGGRLIEGFPRSDASVNEVAVIGVGTNPKPEHSVRRFHTDGAVAQTDPHRPELSNPLEMEGWVSRVRLEQGKSFVSEFLDRGRERSIARPKVQRGVVVHSFVERLALWSRSARSAMASSFPLLTSASNSWSQVSASKVINHSRNAVSSSGESSWIWLSSSFTLLMTRLSMVIISPLTPICDQPVVRARPRRA